jgi:hypothetical protein
MHFGEFVWEYRNHQAAISRELRVAVKWDGRYNVLLDSECWTWRDEKRRHYKLTWLIDGARGEETQGGPGSWISPIAFYIIT